MLALIIFGVSSVKTCAGPYLIHKYVVRRSTTAQFYLGPGLV